MLHIIYTLKIYLDEKSDSMITVMARKILKLYNDLVLCNNVFLSHHSFYQVSVACRPQDRALCSQASEMARMKLSTGGASVSVVPSITVIGDGDREHMLPESSCGGVVVYSADMRTACKNTLDERLKISYEQCTPKIRAKLMEVGL